MSHAEAHATIWADTLAYYRRAPRPAAAVPLVSYDRVPLNGERYHDAPVLNISTRRIGGLRFIKVGRFCVSLCVTSTYRPL